MTPYQCCPFHTDEDQLTKVEAEDGWHLTCHRTDDMHPVAGRPYTWLAPKQSDNEAGASGLTSELGLFEELPAALGRFGGQWVEYGVLEAAYADARPDDFHLLVQRYGHTAIAAKRYTASAFLGRALGEITRSGSIHGRMAPATGRWRYNSEISWWAMEPDTPLEASISWAGQGRSMSYVPGSTEICPVGRCTATDPSECNCA